MIVPMQIGTKGRAEPAQSKGELRGRDRPLIRVFDRSSAKWSDSPRRRNPRNGFSSKRDSLKEEEISEMNPDEKSG